MTSAARARQVTPEQMEVVTEFLTFAAHRQAPGPSQHLHHLSGVLQLRHDDASEHGAEPMEDIYQELPQQRQSQRKICSSLSRARHHSKLEPVGATGGAFLSIEARATALTPPHPGSASGKQERINPTDCSWVTPPHNSPPRCCNRSSGAARTAAARRADPKLVAAPVDAGSLPCRNRHWKRRCPPPPLRRPGWQQEKKNGAAKYRSTASGSSC